MAGKSAKPWQEGGGKGGGSGGGGSMTLNERPVEPFPERNHRLQPFNVESQEVCKKQFARIVRESTTPTAVAFADELSDQCETMLSRALHAAVKKHTVGAYP